MNMSAEINMDKLAENLLVFDQLLVKTMSTGSLRLDIRDVDNVKLNGSVAKLGTAFDDVDLTAAVRLDGDQILSTEGATSMMYDENQKPEALIPPVPQACPQRTGAFLKRLVQIIKTDVGLIFLLVVYSLLGATAFYHMEHELDEQLKVKIKDERRWFAERIWNVTVRDLHPECRHHLHRHHHGLHHHQHFVAYDNMSKPSTLENATNSSVPGMTSTIHVNYSEIEELLENYSIQKTVTQPNFKIPGWTFWGALFYCGTIFTTVGYGHIVPLTTAGRIMTMIYAAFGIPLCLVVLASLGKLLTRAIKYLWSFVLLFYYTGSVRRVRHWVPLSRLRMTFAQRVRDRLHRRTLRLRASRQQQRASDETAAETDVCVATSVMEAQAELQRLEAMDKAHVVSFEVDDKFNLPPIVALVIAAAYILLGVFMYRQWETWSYLEAFYFVFISLCTVGFGDIVPEHPKFFLASSVYLLIGMALVAMVVNVFMETVNSTIAIAKDKVYNVGRRIADVAEMQRERLAHHHPGAALKDLQQAVAIQGLVFRPKQFQRRCSV